MDTNNAVFGRVNKHNVMRHRPAPTPYAMRNIDATSASAFRLIIDDGMMGHITKMHGSRGS
mgnify:CR=1 FL=1